MYIFLTPGVIMYILLVLLLFWPNDTVLIPFTIISSTSLWLSFDYVYSSSIECAEVLGSNRKAPHLKIPEARNCPKNLQLESRNPKLEDTMWSTYKQTCITESTWPFPYRSGSETIRLGLKVLAFGRPTMLVGFIGPAADFLRGFLTGCSRGNRIKAAELAA